MYFFCLKCLSAVSGEKKSTLGAKSCTSATTFVGWSLVLQLRGSFICHGGTPQYMQSEVSEYMYLALLQSMLYQTILRTKKEERCRMNKLSGES